VLPDTPRTMLQFLDEFSEAIVQDWWLVLSVIGHAGEGPWSPSWEVTAPESSKQGVVDLPRFSREVLGHSPTVFSNSVGLVKSRAEWRRTGL
jgi:hypothetical protein